MIGSRRRAVVSCLAQVDAVDVREPEIEDHERDGRVDRLSRRGPVDDPRDVPVVGERPGEVGADHLVVLDDHDPRPVHDDRS